MSCTHPLLASLPGGCPKCPPEPQATPQDPPATLSDVQAEKCRRRLSHFVRYGWHVIEPGKELDWNWHIEAICDEVQELLDWQAGGGDVAKYPTGRNLVINVPPGSLKSRILSVYGPAWAWIHWPHWRVICLSSNPRCTIRDARFSRQLLESEWYQSKFNATGWTFRKDQDATTDFGNTAGGVRNSGGLTAGIVGQRADAIFIDDPHDPHDANSDTKRNAANDKYRDSVHNRVNSNDTAIRILIMQRLNEGDLSGIVLPDGDWDHLRLPTEYDDNPACDCKACCRGTTIRGFKDPRTRPGEILHESRMTPQFIAAERKRLGSYGYAGQHQQRPAPAGGGIFKRKWWSWIDPSKMPERFDRVIMSVDCSHGSMKATASRNGIGVIGQLGPHYYVLDMDAKLGGYLDTVARMEAMRKKWPVVSAVLIELKANGSSVIETLQRTWPDLIPYNPGQDSKVSRAMAITPLVEAGSVTLVKGQPWIDEFLHEFSTFPNGKNDDQVDVLAQAIAYMRGSSDYAKANAAWGSR